MSIGGQNGIEAQQGSLPSNPATLVDTSSEIMPVDEHTGAGLLRQEHNAVQRVKREVHTKMKIGHL